IFCPVQRSMTTMPVIRPKKKATATRISVRERNRRADPMLPIPLNQPTDQQITRVCPDEGAEDEDQLLGDLFDLPPEEIDFKRSDGVEGSSDGGHHGPDFQLVGQVDHFAHRRFVPEEITDPPQLASPEYDPQAEIRR